MPKNIVLFSDGTGNSAGKLFKTNVWRLYQAVDLSGPRPAPPNKPEQVAYYDDGVGTSAFKPLALLGGAFGWGLKRNVIDLYTFLCRNYEEGDRIYGFGFSRGAFTIRVLTGLINNQGLVRAETEAKLRRLATDAFRAYRAERYRTRIGLERPARALRGRVIRAKNFIRRLETYRIRDTARKPSIAFLGLWDTVDAYGLPIDELTRAWNALFPLSVPDREPSAIVRRACHALALDDERNTFHPVLWNENNLPGRNIQTLRIQDERITQVWFTGMHSNVGGGYPDDALAHVSLDWMMGEAERAGLVFKPGERDKIKAAADICGRLYDSRRGLGGTYRYLPRKLAVLTNDIDDKRNQVVIKRPKMHESVIERIKKGVDGYVPLVLPARYGVVTANGDILDAPPITPSATRVIEHPTQAQARANLQEKVWNLVWCKRVAYFTSIIVAVALAAFPLYRTARSACEGPLCALSPVVTAIGIFLPGSAGPWLNAYESHPGSFGLLVLLLIALVYAGSRLQVRIFDEMRAIWRPILENLGSPVPIAAAPGGALFRLRSHPLYQSFFKFMRRVVFPFVAGVTAALVIVGGISQGVFAVMSSAGIICTPTKSGRLEPGILDKGTFSNDALCWASGVEIEEGKRYRLTITIDDKDPWMDGTIRPGIGGFGTELMTPAMFSGLLLRRHIGEPWFKPIARIGNQGSDEYPLGPVGSSVRDRTAKRLVAEIAARRSGELFLFVNDASP
ncbi:MAG: DUF2235 domain-containing protein [Deltaproteobacteria bacterium]|nr:DUF2235 domain-containing protein [Deltaproteobacteria bacterium]